MKDPADPSLEREASLLLAQGATPRSVTDQISEIPLKGPHPRFWWGVFAVAFALVCLLLCAITWLFVKGVGVWGINIPIGWGFAIINLDRKSVV